MDELNTDFVAPGGCPLGEGQAPRFGALWRREGQNERDVLPLRLHSVEYRQGPRRVFCLGWPKLEDEVNGVAFGGWHHLERLVVGNVQHTGTCQGQS